MGKSTIEIIYLHWNIGRHIHNRLETEQLEKFNALKASKPEAAEIVDHMEFETEMAE